MDAEDWGFVVCILALFFLFTGEPDLWDKLHAAAMRWADGACVAAAAK